MFATTGSDRQISIMETCTSIV